MLSTWIKSIMGHNNLAYFHSKLNPEIDPTCRLCLQANKTFHHLMTDCVATTSLQLDIMKNQIPLPAHVLPRNQNAQTMHQLTLQNKGLANGIKAAALDHTQYNRDTLDLIYLTRSKTARNSNHKVVHAPEQTSRHHNAEIEQQHRRLFKTRY